mmetsp:Transcript_31884/g.63667  ORF Transcript_31884/g.63667 Transcript_31884/m.63667 type:complete len:140 (-) Transcript_31884:95-514(-)|eukprot:CAMPEP_0174730280 /NCGR_PEP_ID=MMETSP1094-20130205/55277_1 /TAXON_ID=156173 /ORGANISM="Chrysochromulina brevifilum, Strain UTEX LB 985" /LENGTH=139 /DNA_ID=CAMNT_0015932515 /DNA_START=182 /DNA_END=601 /DNA_ORIENTATION=-
MPSVPLPFSALGLVQVATGHVERFDVGPRSYCVYHAADDGRYYATAGTCTHGAASLADGVVVGNLIECPKHNGCFDFKTGQPKRLPVRAPLKTFPVRIEGQTVFVKVDGRTPAGGRAGNEADSEGGRRPAKHITLGYED